jgi:hypothetical protein
MKSHRLVHLNPSTILVVAFLNIYFCFLCLYRKTFTMGSGIEYTDPTKEGILPRAFMHIFQRCASYEQEAESKGIPISKCVVSCQFIEV